MDSGENLDFGQKLQKKMLELGLVTNLSRFKGCTADEVEQVRIGQQVDFLPTIYREFLMEMGRLAQPLMPDETYTYPDVCELKSWLTEDAQYLKLELGLPADVFIMARSTDGRCMIFRTVEQEENPIVYEYFLGRPPGVPLASLAEWFDSTIQAAVRLREVYRDLERRYGIVPNLKEKS